MSHNEISSEGLANVLKYRNSMKNLLGYENCQESFEKFKRSQENARSYKRNIICVAEQVCPIACHAWYTDCVNNNGGEKTCQKSKHILEKCMQYAQQDIVKTVQNDLY